MKTEIPIDEVKSIQLEILDYINTTLKGEQIPYWLAYGTLLGSIRHKGYIPWDDDIDIIVLRKDLDRAISVLNSNSDRYKTLTMNNTNGYYYLFAKVTDTYTHIIEKGVKEIDELGIYVDLFPLDYLPLDDKEYAKHVNKIFRLRSLLYGSLLDFSQFRAASIGIKCKSLIGKLLGSKRLMIKVDNICRQYSEKQEGYIADIVGAGNKNRKISSRVFSKTINGEFEGRMYPIPVGYEEYLTCIYGDYMKLPPKEEQVLTHGFRAYWRN